MNTTHILVVLCRALHLASQLGNLGRRNVHKGASHGHSGTEELPILLRRRCLAYILFSPRIVSCWSVATDSAPTLSYIGFLSAFLLALATLLHTSVDMCNSRSLARASTASKTQCQHHFDVSPGLGIFSDDAEPLRLIRLICALPPSEGK
jgi:hypothetical protein